MRKTVLGLAALCTAAGAACGQIDPIGPFTGDISDPFPGPFFGFAPCVPSRVFNNTADLCANSAHLTGSWGFMCSIRARSAPLLFGSTGTPAEYTFDTPAGKFGGFFGTNSGTAGAMIEFYDEGGALIEAEPAAIPADCSWTWFGWESTTVGIKKIRVVGNNPFGGGFINMDDMEYSEFTGAGCYPDCDTTTGPGVLDIFDFLCFQNRYDAGSPYACDCDTTTGVGLCDIFDFLCFQNAYDQGCP